MRLDYRKQRKGQHKNKALGILQGSANTHQEKQQHHTACARNDSIPEKQAHITHIEIFHIVRIAEQHPVPEHAAAVFKGINTGNTPGQDPVNLDYPGRH